MENNLLYYAILKYSPSLVSGENINIAALFYYPDSKYKELYTIRDWKRVAAFDDTLNIPLLKDVLLDIGDDIGTALMNSEFDINTFCAQYHSELYFSAPECITNITVELLSEQIEEIKRMYFQFEYAQALRPTHGQQKTFLSKILRAKAITYKKDLKVIGKYQDQITYDYVIKDCGVKFMDLNQKKGKGNTLTSAKAWAWNCMNRPKETSKIIILVDYDENESELQPVLDILNAVADDVINIHDGFEKAIQKIMDNVS